MSGKSRWEPCRYVACSAQDPPCGFKRNSQAGIKGLDRFRKLKALRDWHEVLIDSHPWSKTGRQVFVCSDQERGKRVGHGSETALDVHRKKKEPDIYNCGIYLRWFLSWCVVLYNVVRCHLWCTVFLNAGSVSNGKIKLLWCWKNEWKSFV